MGTWEAKKGEKAKRQQTTNFSTVPAVHGREPEPEGSYSVTPVPFQGTAPADPAERVFSPRTIPGCRWPHAPAAPLPAPAEGRSSSRQKPRVPPPVLRDRPEMCRGGLPAPRRGRGPFSSPGRRAGSEPDAVFCRAAAALLDSSGARRGAHVPETAQM